MNNYLMLATSLLAFLSAPIGVAGEEKEMRSETYDPMNEPGSVMFTPPQGWRYADPSQLGKAVQLMVVGEGASHFPPSINLATESYDGTLKDYLKIMKKINDVEGSVWKDLGTIKTHAGNASLSQVDIKNQWGEVREMHVVLKKKNTIYILTVAALKDEFSKYYKNFFESMRSLKINKEFDEMISSPSLREELLKKIAALKMASQKESFDSPTFQNTEWSPFLNFLKDKYSFMGAKWIGYVEKRVESDLKH